MDCKPPTPSENGTSTTPTGPDRVFADTNETPSQNPLSAASTHASANDASVSDCAKTRTTHTEGEAEADAPPIMEHESRHARRFFAMKLKSLLSHDEDLSKKLEAIVSDDAELSDPDDPNDIIVHEELRGWLGEDMNTRRKRARLRALQTQAHTQLVEDRLYDLEAKVRKLLKEPDPALNDDEEHTAFPPHERRIKSLTWKDFNARLEVDAKQPSQWKHRPEIDLEPKSIIEVLGEEPRYTWAYAPSNKYSSAAPAESERPVSVVPESSNAVAVTLPYRIRIRSKLLLKVIKELTNCRTTTGIYEHRMLLFPPFKLLVTHNYDFRVGLKKLEDKHRGIEQDPASRPIEGPENDTQTVEARSQLRLLCETIDKYFLPQLKLLHDLSPSSAKVKFTDLWYIFKPGYEVRTPGNSRIQLYRIIKVNGGRDLLRFSSPPELPASKKLSNAGYSEGSFIIECFYINFDGSKFGPVNVTFQIRKFEGERDIASLPVYPLACDPDKEQIRNRLLTRGRLFADLSNPRSSAHRKYKGLTLDKRQEHVESEVVVDFQLAFTQTDIERPVISLEGLVEDDDRELAIPGWATTSNVCDRSGCCGNDAIYMDYEIDEKERSTFMADRKDLHNSPDDPGSLVLDQLVLLPHQVYGFVLRTRKWATFDIDLLEPPDYGDGWSNLVIKPEIKEMVLALVENHQRPGGSRVAVEGALPSVDLVQGKGKGLIILLHGEPGVGKTSTAECVAGHTKRPLFPITCGDIGEKADDVEDNLEKNFQLAHKWGCVLLLDEADVFLSKRTSDDIQRNAIVSVFLRTLEYYSGILFLTTNRVGKIDKAFKSRIHLSLLYRKLDLDSTVQIWENNLIAVTTDLRKQGMEVRCEQKEILHFAKRHFKKMDSNESKGRNKKLRVWNGRQIRNAFQTAVAISKYEAKGDRPDPPKEIILKRCHFEKVATIALGFEKYLNSLHSGRNDADLAKIWQVRADDFVDEDEKVPEREKNKASRKRSSSPGEKWQAKKRKKKRSETPESLNSSSSDFSDSSGSGRSSWGRKDHRRARY